MPSIACLPVEELRAYLHGETPELRSAEIADHLRSCDLCEAETTRIEETGDPLLRSLRRVYRENPTGSIMAMTGHVHEPPAFLTHSSGATHKIPNYEILEELGRGGMSIVYRARQRWPERVVALKMILAGTYATPERRTRFLAEANTIASLQHPGIVSVFEVGIFDDALAFSMEVMDGGSLHDKLGGMPQTSDSSAILVGVIARTVHFAHQQGILHRDINPPTSSSPRTVCRRSPTSASRNSSSHSKRSILTRTDRRRHHAAPG